MATIISTKNILDNANDFKYIAEKIVSDIDTKYKHYPVQFFVNGLLSIELYLKVIYFANNNGTYPKNKKGHGIHNLIELFEMIPGKDKNQLKEKLPEIELLLKEYADGFREFRYSYEIFLLHGNQESIVKMMAVFKEYCNNEYREVIKKYFDSNHI